MESLRSKRRSSRRPSLCLQIWFRALGFVWLASACGVNPTPEVIVTKQITLISSPTKAPSPPPSKTLRPATATPTGALTSTQVPPTSTPAPIRLIYVFPVQPPEVATYEQGHHDYPATDIFAPQGNRFVAVTSGVIDFVSLEDQWDPNMDDPATRGGLSVAIIGDDGVRYYGSHLSAIAPGIEPSMRVSAGQLLGYIGNTGNARYVASHLHFGISHPTYPTDWLVRRGEVDPYPYLRKWEKGQSVTPSLPAMTSKAF